MFAAQLDDHLDELAHHYSRSDNVAKAVDYLGRAGQQALQRSAYTDAIRSLNAALDLVQRLPESLERFQREVFLQLTLARTLTPLESRAAPEVERAYTRARELCERLADPPELFPTLVGLLVIHLLRGELRNARQLALQLAHRAQSVQDPAGLLYAQVALGEISFFSGELPAAREHLEMAMSLDRECRWTLAFRPFGADVGVVCLSYLAHTLWHLGYPVQALKRSKEALELAQGLSDPFSVGFAMLFVTLMHQCRRETSTVQKTAESLTALAAEYGFRQILAFAPVMRGWATAAEGHKEDGIAQIQEGLAATRALGLQVRLPRDLSLLAERYIDMHRLDDALAALTEALATAEERENRNYEPETHRLKGELLLKQNDSNAVEAESCFGSAIEIACKQSAKSWELRATTSLARLLARTGRPDEARSMLAGIYNWFTEGFDTADLKDAKALLEQLSG
jgi:predicted ATPase